MHIDFLGLQAFLSIAERGSFRRGAAHLNLSQTALSHRMKKLEDALGVKLFIRTTREVTLTRAGLEFLPKARKAVADLEGSFDELRQLGTKRQERLAIACLPAFAIYHLPRVLGRFHKRHPKVEVRIFEYSSSEVAGLVQSGAVEFGHVPAFDTANCVGNRRADHECCACARPGGQGRRQSALFRNWCRDRATGRSRPRALPEA